MKKAVAFEEVKGEVILYPCAAEGGDDWLAVGRAKEDATEEEKRKIDARKSKLMYEVTREEIINMERDAAGE